MIARKILPSFFDAESPQRQNSRPLFLNRFCIPRSILCNVSNQIDARESHISAESYPIHLSIRVTPNSQKRISPILGLSSIGNTSVRLGDTLQSSKSCRVEKSGPAGQQEHYDKDKTGNSRFTQLIPGRNAEGTGAALQK